MPNLIALRKVKIVYNFGLPECNRVKFLCDGHGAVRQAILYLDRSCFLLFLHCKTTNSVDVEFDSLDPQTLAKQDLLFKERVGSEVDLVSEGRQK